MLLIQVIEDKFANLLEVCVGQWVGGQVPLLKLEQAMSSRTWRLKGLPLSLSHEISSMLWQLGKRSCNKVSNSQGRAGSQLIPQDLQMESQMLHHAILTTLACSHVTFAQLLIYSLSCLHLFNPPFGILYTDT